MRVLPRLSQMILVTLVALFLVAAPTLAAEPADFTIVMIPDTQNYSEKFPETYRVQTEWIRDVAAERNVKFAIHLGDIVQVPDQEGEWQAADHAHQAMDGKVPYSVLPGNHDGAPGATTLFNKYFPPKRFADTTWYAGNKDGKSDNNYCRFTAGGMPLSGENSDRTYSKLKFRLLSPPQRVTNVGLTAYCVLSLSSR